MEQCKHCKRSGDIMCPCVIRIVVSLADLLQEGSFDEVVAGADIVFHTASPFFTK